MRDAILLFQLRSYATLTVGTPLSIRYANEDFLFDVVALAAVEQSGAMTDDNDADDGVEAVSLLNVDLQLDVIEPLETVLPIEPLTLDAPVEGKVARNTYAHFCISLRQDDEGDVELITTPSNDGGDPDLFVSTVCRRPTADDYEWQSQSRGETRLLLKQQQQNSTHSTASTTSAATTSTSSKPILYFVGVYAYGDQDCSFTLAAKRAVASGHRLGGVDDNNDANLTKCELCGRRVPKQSLAMHELGCQRNNSTCDQCGDVMDK